MSDKIVIEKWRDDTYQLYGSFMIATDPVAKDKLLALAAFIQQYFKQNKE